MNKKAGKACKYIKPRLPDEPLDADSADPGEVAKAKAKEKETQTGKYGSTKAKPFKEPPPGEEDEAKEKSWIEIALHDQEGEPIAGERYEIKLPDGKIASGSLDGDGHARIKGFDPGRCEVSFPGLDKDATEPDS